MTRQQNPSELGKRILGSLIDYTTIFLLMLLLSLVYLVFAGAFNFEIEFIELIIFAFLWFFLIVLVEYKFGYTLGKKVVGIKTISLNDNRKPTFLQILKRRILDPIDILALGIVSIIVISTSKKNQRFGDMFANTTVVRNK